MKNTNKEGHKCTHKNKIAWVIALAVLAALAAWYLGSSSYKGKLAEGVKEELQEMKDGTMEKAGEKTGEAMEVMEGEAMEEEMTHEKDMSMEHIVISDNEVVDGEVEITGVNLKKDGWVVIHNVVDGKAGPVVGHAAVKKGGDTHIKVKIDTEKATESLIAMAHVDKGVIGKYEFPGVDAPLKVGEKIVLEKFSTAKKEGVTKEELVKHNTKDDCWVVYKGSVYDVTKWLPVHPGGADKISQFCGTVKFEETYDKKHGKTTGEKIENTLKKNLLKEEGKLK